ncbi:MAG TPA: hypothetical protein VF875_04655 [Anaeromyxobacter sp.]
MIRATIWTVGLFGAGTALVRAFPGTWTEPIVLLALGLALLFASARTARTPRAVRAAQGAADAATSSGAVRGVAPLPAPATVEQA